MFKLDDTVEDKDGAQGTIVYIEDNLVYVELLSGVEMEYRTSDIFPVGTHQEKINKRFEELKAKKTLNTTNSDNPLLEASAVLIMKQMGNFTLMAEKFHNSVNDSFNQERNWKNASGQQQLNVLAAMLSISVREFYIAFTNETLPELKKIIEIQLARNLFDKMIPEQNNGDS